MEKNFQYKLILVGDCGVGKSSIHHQLTEDQFKSTYKSTIGIDYGTYLIKRPNLNIRLQIWDTAGQEVYHSLVRAYFRNKIGAIVVFDITDKETFRSVSQWIREIRIYCSPEIQITLVGNKKDLANKRQVNIDEIEKYIKENEIDYYEVSAKNSSEITELFDKITDKITDKFIANREDDNERLPDGISKGGSYISAIENPQVKKNSCCYLI